MHMAIRKLPKQLGYGSSAADFDIIAVRTEK
jgi:hypothetical protein